MQRSRRRGSRCLVLGPRGAGKSLLVRKLKSLEREKGREREIEGSGATREVPPPTQPTVGTSVEELQLGKNVSCLVKEYGGAMAPVWSAAYSDCDLVVYVIDATNCTQTSAATVLLLDVLRHEALKEKPFLLVFNKLDRQCPMNLTEFKTVMRLGDILQHATQKVQLVEGSCAEESLLVQQVHEWLFHSTNLIISGVS
jgi:GTPase SAR1 family protein